MSAREREIRMRIVATDTHCGEGSDQCAFADASWQVCTAFGERELELDHTSVQYKRLPECIAAEGAGQKGGDK